MNNLNDEQVRKIEYQKDLRIVTTDKGKYIIKKKKQDKSKIYRYLISRDFTFFPEIYEEINDGRYEVRPFIEEAQTPKDQKALDVIHLMSLLHNKTSFYQEVDSSDAKEMYENLNDSIENTRLYYMDLQNSIISEIFMPPDHYHLVRNVSQIYLALKVAKDYLDRWYEIVKNKTKKRVALIHNNLDTSHYISGIKPTFINWDYAKVDIPILDFYTFYKRECQEFDFSILYKSYVSKYPLMEEEKYLLWTLLLIPEKINFEKQIYMSTVNSYYLVLYVNKTLDLVLKEEKKYAEQK